MILYRLLFPLVFLFFLPGLIIKLIRRPGRKKNYAERFAIFSRERRDALQKMEGAVWFHAVSVGETNVALSMLKKWIEKDPSQKFVFSTTTTTAQEIAWNKVPENVEVFFCPIDCTPFVRKALRMIKPSALVIFETELWPNLLHESAKAGIKLFLANGRISDHSAKSYQRFRCFFAPLLRQFNVICAQTDLDKERFLAIDPNLNVQVTGNIKFDQIPPADLVPMDLNQYFGDNFIAVLACSTHAPEEKMILNAFMTAQKKAPSMKLVIVPRHAERGSEIENTLADAGISYYRKTSGKTLQNKVECLLADTTGELMKFIKAADIVLMGKTFCGNNEGQNVIEPSMLGKAIVTGPEMRNFKQAFNALTEENGVRSIADDSLLPETIASLALDPQLRSELGQNALKAVSAHAGALNCTIQIMQEKIRTTEN